MGFIACFVLSFLPLHTTPPPNQSPKTFFCLAAKLTQHQDRQTHNQLQQQQTNSTFGLGTSLLLSSSCVLCSVVVVALPLAAAFLLGCNKSVEDVLANPRFLPLECTIPKSRQRVGYHFSCTGWKPSPTNQPANTNDSSHTHTHHTSHIRSYTNIQHSRTQNEKGTQGKTHIRRLEGEKPPKPAKQSDAWWSAQQRVLLLDFQPLPDTIAHFCSFFTSSSSSSNSTITITTFCIGVTSFSPPLLLVLLCVCVCVCVCSSLFFFSLFLQHTHIHKYRRGWEGRACASQTKIKEPLGLVEFRHAEGPILLHQPKYPNTTKTTKTTKTKPTTLMLYVSS